MQKRVDSQLIKRLKNGDESAFNEVYYLFSEKIYQTAYRFLGDEDRCEDVVQETFISLWTSKEKLDVSGDLWLYVYVIAKRKSLDILRDVKKSFILSEKLMISMEELRNHTEDRILGDELQRITNEILDQLPRQQQTVFQLSRVGGLSHQEIAQKLSISKNTVKNHTAQALKTLRLKIQDYTSVVIFLLFFIK